MKKEELDKYLNKYVQLIDFTNRSYKGFLLKIRNFKFEVNKQTYDALINNGYVLDCDDCRWVNFRKSHIKKISLIKE
jgi:hypothetical protein